MRRWAAFDSDLPYDGIEDETGFIQYPGKALAEAIAEMLLRLGCTRAEIDPLEYRGYEVVFDFGKKQFRVRVTMIDQYMLTFSQYSFMDRLRRRFSPEYLEILHRMNAELNRDGRFHRVRWFADDEVLTGIEGELSLWRSDRRSSGLQVFGRRGLVGGAKTEGAPYRSHGGA